MPHLAHRAECVMAGPPADIGCDAAAARQSRTGARSCITMPIYEYACQDCGSEFELLVRSDTVAECPTCQSTQLEKQLSVFATAAATPDAAPAMAGPCGSCGHPDGPGSCAFH
jgi:putative FmdB family regulatory protein